VNTKYVGPWLIWSNEHNSWWAPNSHGYVSHIEHAGRYDFVEAIEICRGANQHLTHPKRNSPKPQEAMLLAPEAYANFDAMQKVEGEE